MSAVHWALCALLVLAARAGALELDPAACATRFDVQRDKIIRTEESRSMGARYLAELDVGARSECLRLCCETDACDVFVYEEKSPGSCYLFACGPPEDFRCKFTAHGNFSSGVLDVARRRAEQQDRARLELHEQQLASLRSATAPPASTSTATTPAPRPLAPPTTPAPPPLPPPRRCSRWQFECHNGGECIAVYNACDGVPQCADGSDEAPELGCPPAAPPAPPAPAPTPAPTRSPEQNSLEALQVAQESGERWPHRLAQAQPRRGGAPEGPHIFSHKGGLLQEPPEPASFPYDEQPAWPRPPWGQPHQNVMDGAWGGYGRADWGEPDPRRAWPVPPPRPESDIPVYIPQKTMPELPLAYGGAHTLRDAPKKGPPPRAPSPPPASRAPPERAVTVKQEQAVVPPEARAEADIEVQRGAAPAHAPHLLADERDGLSDRPPAAVLLLVLGVLMTSALALLAGCRARAARRRLRRGKSPFAHDADYLVNGMYL